MLRSTNYYRNANGANCRGENGITLQSKWKNRGKREINDDEKTAGSVDKAANITKRKKLLISNITFLAVVL